MTHRLLIVSAMSLALVPALFAEDAPAPGSPAAPPAEVDAKPAPESPSAPPAGVAPTDAKNQYSYAIGRNIGMNMRMQGLSDSVIDVSAIAAGITEALQDKPSRYTDEQLQAAMMSLQETMMNRRAEEGKKNEQEGKAYQDANKAKEGVTVLPSGIQYQVIKSGAGRKPVAADTVRTHYRGTLIDGTEFDSSYERGEPVEFAVNEVIPGWTEVLQLMKEGDKWRVVIPGHLAYGERGAGGRIGPNATLVFEIELLSVVPAPAP